MKWEKKPASDLPRTPEDRGTRDVPVIETQQLFGTSQEVRIQHRGEEYRLRITRNQKLILTK